jgi:hypothetical protein
MPVKISRAPDLRLAAFELWVHGYQYPELDDPWDGNWLRVTARCSAGGASVEASGTFLDTVAVDRFRRALAEVHRTLGGGAFLGTDEPELDVRATAARDGHIRLRVELTPDHMAQGHWFEFDIDQTYLPPAIAQCAAILERYPIRSPAARGG